MLRIFFKNVKNNFIEKLKFVVHKIKFILRIIQNNIIIEKYKFNDRQKKILGMLFEGFNGNLTSVKWAKITKISQMTANRDITELLEKNFLIKNGKGKNTYYTLPEF